MSTDPTITQDTLTDRTIAIVECETVSEEFPELADESNAALKAAHETHIVNVLYDNLHARRYCAAFLLEAMKQAHQDGHYCPDYLRAMARRTSIKASRV